MPGADVGLKPSSLVKGMPRGWRGVRLSSLLGLLGLVLLAPAQNATIAFWSLPDDKMDALALHVPADDHGRYQELLDEFKGLHCPPGSLREQPAGKREGRNLICTLPGQDTGLIIVAARYDHKKGAAKGSRWGEAMMLPLLYNALRAQPRAHTFVFAALNGEAGEQAFFEDLHRNGRPPVNALVVLDDLGRTTPFIYIEKPQGFSKKAHELATARGQLESEAIATARLQQVPNPRIPFLVVNSSILSRDADTPSILIFSSVESRIVVPTGQTAIRPPFPVASDVSGPAFRQGFNFVAYFLCRIDTRAPAST
jgi:hypothetical protein